MCVVPNSERTFSCLVKNHRRDEVVALAKRIEKAGASIINSGIGWHEARIPTIATMVPRAGFTWATKKLKGQARDIWGSQKPVCM